jgi:predicted O-methyltransferase YrrM
MDDATATYLRSRYWEEDELLRELREDLERRGPTIQVSAETGRLLATMIAATRGGFTQVVASREWLELKVA